MAVPNALGPPFKHPPERLNPSKLGSKQYWDAYYQEDLANLEDQAPEDRDLDCLSTWFDDSSAPQKILKFLVGQNFPLAPCHHLSCPSKQCPSVLDLGTGNGRMLFQLRLQGRFRGPMAGVDYSESSIQLARELGHHYGCQDINFEMVDILKDDPRQQEWWLEDGFDLVLDKGTFDAVSLSEDVPALPMPLPAFTDDAPRRIHAFYPSRALQLVKPGGFLLVTSCNWTEEELINWFTNVELDSSHVVHAWKAIEYEKFKFGGREGQKVCTVCFRKDPGSGGD